MLSPQTVAALQTEIHAWYRGHQRPLPWRKTRDPYRIWVSEVMLQQTQVQTVIPYYRDFLEQFPDAASLAGARLEHVLKAWEGLGYYARARNLHRAAQIVMEHHQGKIPDQWKAFRQLPGAGDYITAAVLSLAFGQPYAAVDGNVKRVLARLLVQKTPVNQGTAAAFTRAAAELLDRRRPGLHNQAMMELGALVCTPKKPRCAACPVNRYCLARQQDCVDRYPFRRPSPRIPTRHVAAGVVVRGGQLLITRRPPRGLLGGLWEFPGGGIESAETPQQACVREIAEETGLLVTVEHKLASVKHAYTHFKVVLEVFLCHYQGGEVVLNGPVDHCWITPDQISQYPFPRANHKFIPIINELF